MTIGKLSDLIDPWRALSSNDRLWLPGDRDATHVTLVDDAPQFAQKAFIGAILGARLVQSQHIDVVGPQAPQALDDRSFDLFRVQPVFVPDSAAARLHSAQSRKRFRHSACHWP